MARNFGKTWWGEQWLGALTHIDYANRIPRGASYARKGAVTKLAINKNKGEIKMFEKMKELIAEQLNCPAEEIKMESSFKEDLGADSLDLFELVMSLEDTYGVEIPSEELEQLTTVESVVDYLKQKGVEA